MCTGRGQPGPLIPGGWAMHHADLFLALSCTCMIEAQEDQPSRPSRGRAGVMTDAGDGPSTLSGRSQRRRGVALLIQESDVKAKTSRCCPVLGRCRCQGCQAARGQVRMGWMEMEPGLAGWDWGGSAARPSAHLQGAKGAGVSGGRERPVALESLLAWALLCHADRPAPHWPGPGGNRSSTAGCWTGKSLTCGRGRPSLEAEH
ncbi:hypothetical protein EV126DRAFT_107479 [Verticillium dahliae]|nr:hypothetical protein EV126DRAFT_107479 [Verticillium dahliae]